MHNKHAHSTVHARGEKQPRSRRSSATACLLLAMRRTTIADDDNARDQS